MEKNISEILQSLEDRLKAAEQVIIKFDEQAERRLEAREREKELEARILEAKLQWRPKDWFILSGIISALIGFLAVLALIVVLAFSYTPSNKVVKDVSNITTTNSNDSSSNSTEADFIIE